MQPDTIFNTIRHPTKKAFLLAFATCGQIGKAAQQVECHRGSHYVWLKDDQYREAFDIAKQMAADVLEEEATRRAMGWDETRYADDGTPYTIRKYSDTLLIVRLKAAKPEEYRENTHVQVEGEVVLALEDRTRQANDRLTRLRRADSYALPA